MTVIFMISILIGAFQGLKLGMTARIICATALYEKVNKSFNIVLYYDYFINRCRCCHSVRTLLVILLLATLSTFPLMIYIGLI